MINKWDLLILNPVLLVAGLIILGYLVYKERTSLKWILFFGLTLGFWFVNSMVLKMNLNQLQVESTFNNPVLIMLVFLGSSFLFGAILKPFATWLTGKTHNRKWWINFSFLGLIFALIFTLINQQLNSAAIYVFVAVFLGLAISSNSLYFLMLNEQFYYRIAPVLSTTLIAVGISFATFTGNYLIDLESTLKSSSTLFLTGSIIVAFVVLTFFGIGINILKEDKQYVTSFEITQLTQLPKYKHSRLFGLMLTVFLLAGFFALTQSSIMDDYLKASFVVKEVSLDQAEPWVRSFKQFYVIPQFLLGYLIYRKVTLKLGYKSVLIGTFALVLGVVFLIIYFNNPYLIVISNFVLGLAFSQVFYAYFSMAMMWNYRSKNIPVTGLVAGSSMIGTFIVEASINIFKITNTGIFRNFEHGRLMVEQMENFYYLASGVVVILFAVVGVFAILAIVSLFFSFNFLFADYENIQIALQNSKAIIKAHQKEKSTTRILATELKIVEQEEN